MEKATTRTFTLKIGNRNLQLSHDKPREKGFYVNMYLFLFSGYRLLRKVNPVRKNWTPLFVNLRNSSHIVALVMTCLSVMAINSTTIYGLWYFGFYWDIQTFNTD